MRVGGYSILGDACAYVGTTLSGCGCLPDCKTIPRFANGIETSNAIVLNVQDLFACRWLLHLEFETLHLVLHLVYVLQEQVIHLHCIRKNSFNLSTLHHSSSVQLCLDFSRLNVKLAFPCYSHAFYYFLEVESSHLV